MKKVFQKTLALACACAFVMSHQAVAQQKPAGSVSKSTSNASSLQRPKLVVGIVVDQMRYDFLYRYYNRYGNGGFKRLLASGFSCEQTHYNYMPTYTGPGHASIHTGSTPAGHGIIANNWFDRKSGKNVYCAQDDSVSSVGTTSVAGKMSPVRLVGTTVSDQLQLATNRQSKVIGVALKDRGAILPAGHLADAAYWLDDATPDWISSTYYMNELPAWVKEFNAQEKTKQYMSKPWETLYPIQTYTASSGDDHSWERPLKGETKPTFPHDLPGIVARTGNYNVIRTTPFGNDLTTDFAIAALKGENMGSDSITDFLCLSYSSPDYVGHSFGPNSIETEDTYLRLDKDLQRLLDYIDRNIGISNVLFFLTADHGVSEVPSYLKSLRMHSTVVDETSIEKRIKNFCLATFGDTLVASFSNQQVFFHQSTLSGLKLNRHDVAERTAEFIRTQDETYQVYTYTDLTRNEYTQRPAGNIQLGYNHLRSGDIAINYPPHYIDFGDPGTTHGSPYNYDTHVPLLWYGWNIKRGASYEQTSITDIAVTVSAMLRILEPSCATGKVILPLLEK